MEYKAEKPCSSLLREYIRELDIKNLQKTLECEADVDSFINKDGSTALHMASSLSDEADSLTVAEVLLALGANPNVPNKEGKTSLHVAASMGYSRLLDLLLVNGGDPLLGDILGQSPVDCAHHHHHLEVVQQISKLLDTENYSGLKEDSLKFVLSFLRQEVVELMNFPPAGIPESDDICSCDTKTGKGHGCPNSLVSEVNWNIMNDWNLTLQEELLSQERVSTKHTEKTEITKTNKDDQQSYVEVNSTVGPSWLKDLDFLKHLNQEVQRCYSDSDSDNDVTSLRKCLGKSLPCRRSFDSIQEEFGSVVDSHDEFNIAHLSIDVTHDTVNDTEDDLFDGSYIPANTNKKNFLDKWCNISDFDQDKDKTLKCDSEFDCTSVDVTLQQNQTNLINHDMSNHNFSQYSSAETSGEAQKFCGETFADLTAPQDSIKPDACTTLNLLKAPIKKKLPVHISKNNEKTLALKKQLCKDYEGLCEKAISSFNYNPGECKPSEEECTQKQQVSSAQSTPQSSLKSSTKTVHSSGSSCQSFVSVVEEFLYEDAEAGVQLIERRCPTSAVVASLSSTGSRTSVLIRQTTSQKPNSECADQSLDSVGTLTESVKAMNADELRSCLKNLGHVPGPIVPTTHKIYQRLLLRLRKKPLPLQQDDAKSTPQYSRELQAALKDPLSVDWDSWTSLEKVMSAPFCQPDPTRHWRDGTNKTCFNYLLLDPRVTQDLPLRGSVMDEKEKLHCFISAIFYIGKGSRDRPYYHLYEAIKKKNCGKQLSDKIKRIHDIWSEGVGVVSLHVFQNTIPVEAWTREASMISAIGLQNLSNSIQGTFYGLPSTWRWAERRRLGTHLLRRTLGIFMQEGERQLRPSDITLPAWMK